MTPQASVGDDRQVVSKGNAMKTLFTKRFPFGARPAVGLGLSRRATLLATLPLVAAMLCVPSYARADDYAFSVSGGGITSSGVLQVSNTGPFGAYTVTGITGNFAGTALPDASAGW